MAMVQIALLADRPEVIPTLARWFQSQWPEYFAGRTPEDIEQDFRGDLHRDDMPLRLVAFDGGELVGTIVVREHALRGHPEFRPGLGGLYVATPHRGRGIGTELVSAGTAAACRLGYETLYTATNTAGGILARLGWERVRWVLHSGEGTALYRCALSPAAERADEADHSGG